MKLGFEEPQTPYKSGSQSARVWTERWVRDWVYCPNCGSPKINPFPNNSPVADFLCYACREEYELKSQKTLFGEKVLDGSFRTKCARLEASNNPSLFLLNYDLKQLSVTNFFVIPKHFFVREIIQEAQTASSDCSEGRMGGLQHSTQSNSIVGENLHCSCRSARAERVSPCQVAPNPLFAGPRTRSERLADRGNEMRRGYRQA